MIATMNIDDPERKLAAAVVMQALLDACSTDLTRKKEARLWWKRADSVFLSALTNVNISVDDIVGMADEKMREWDEQVLRRAEEEVECIRLRSAEKAEKDEPTTD
jgi:hypothetical protein